MPFMRHIPYRANCIRKEAYYKVYKGKSIQNIAPPKNQQPTQMVKAHHSFAPSFTPRVGPVSFS